MAEVESVTRTLVVLLANVQDFHLTTRQTGRSKPHSAVVVGVCHCCAHMTRRRNEDVLVVVGVTDLEPRSVDRTVTGVHVQRVRGVVHGTRCFGFCVWHIQDSQCIGTQFADGDHLALQDRSRVTRVHQDVHVNDFWVDKFFPCGDQLGFCWARAIGTTFQELERLFLHLDLWAQGVVLHADVLGEVVDCIFQEHLAAVTVQLVLTAYEEGFDWARVGVLEVEVHIDVELVRIIVTFITDVHTCWARRAHFNSNAVVPDTGVGCHEVAERLIDAGLSSHETQSVERVVNAFRNVGAIIEYGQPYFWDQRRWIIHREIRTGGQRIFADNTDELQAFGLGESLLRAIQREAVFLSIRRTELLTQVFTVEQIGDDTDRTH
ncbi:hypothetical protein D3C71_1189140 [compost metagenome]